MSSNLARGIAAAAVLLAVTAGALLLAGGRAPFSVGGPTASPSAAPSPCVVPAEVGNPLSRGSCQFVTGTFRPAFTMTGDVRWIPASEGPRFFELSPRQNEGLAFATIDQVAAKPCQAKELTAPDTSTVPFTASAPGSGPADFLAWIKAHTPLILPTPTTTSIGGQPGLRVTGDVTGGSLAGCNGYVVLSYAGNASPAVDPGAPVRLGKGRTDFPLLDVNGKVVFIAAFAPAGSEAAFKPMVDQFLAGIHFQ
jgi:hypothetical protein